MTQHPFTPFRVLLGGIATVALLAGAVCPAAQAQKPDAKRHTERFHARITPKQAQAAALKKYPGKVAGKIALENEDGAWQYAVNIRSGKTLREVMVDATTGKIANVEVTTRTEEAREQKAETKAAHGGKAK